MTHTRKRDDSVHYTAAPPPPLFAQSRPRTRKQIHPNSLHSYRSIDVSKRELQICEALAAEGRGMTDREIMHAVGVAEKNSVSPGITTLKQKGLIEELGKTKCPTTGKTVRIVGLVGTPKGAE